MIARSFGPSSIISRLVQDSVSIGYVGLEYRLLVVGGYRHRLHNCR